MNAQKVRAVYHQRHRHHHAMDAHTVVIAAVVARVCSLYWTISVRVSLEEVECILKWVTLRRCRFKQWDQWVQAAAVEHMEGDLPVNTWRLMVLSMVDLSMKDHVVETTTWLQVVISDICETCHVWSICLKRSTINAFDCTSLFSPI